MKTKQKPVIIAASAACAIVMPFVMTVMNFNYGILIACFACLYIIASSGLDIDFGFCGQISMGHAAFFAIGAYGSALIHKYTGLPVLITMFLAAVLAAVVGSVIAYPASKLVFHFLSLSTIAFGEIVYTFLLNSPGGITGNAVGLFVDKVSILGFELDSYTRFYFFGIVCLIVFILIKKLLIDSRVGRAWMAIRENPRAANGMGINVTKYKVMAFAVSALFTGYAGAMYAHLVGYIGPDTFTMKQSVMFVTMMLFGGTGSIWGPAIGAVLILLLTEGLRVFEQYQMLIYGIVLLLVIILLPGGVYGEAKNLVKRHTGKKEAV